MSLSTSARSSLLAACPLFSGVTPTDLVALSGAATEIDFAPNHVIAREGDIGTGFFVIVAGRVRVVRSGTVIARLGKGDFFGELSVLDGRPRNATVAADEPTTCLAIATWDFEAALLANPSVTLAILRGVAARLRAETDAPGH